MCAETFNSNLNTCSETFHKQQQHMIRYLQWKIYVELTTYRNILTEFPALVEVDVKNFLSQVQQ
jgi:hypothetical protein